MHRLLHDRSIKDLTIEDICFNAAVSKPTIYKWWPSKAALVLDMFDTYLIETLPDVTNLSAEKAIRKQVAELIRSLNSIIGKVAAEIIALGQSDPEMLGEFRERFLKKRRAGAVNSFQAALKDGTFRHSVDPQLLADIIFGPLYYRLLIKHQKLNQAFGRKLVDQAMKLVH